jgi:hypothetical protein
VDTGLAAVGDHGKGIMTARRVPHDSGPWRLSVARPHAGVVLVFSDARLVGLVVGLGNARLVRAAPDLLDGARALTRWWQAFRRTPPDAAQLAARLREGDRLVARLEMAIGTLQRSRGP